MLLEFDLLEVDSALIEGRLPGEEEFTRMFIWEIDVVVWFDDFKLLIPAKELRLVNLVDLNPLDRQYVEEGRILSKDDRYDDSGLVLNPFLVIFIVSKDDMGRGSFSDLLAETERAELVLELSLKGLWKFGERTLVNFSKSAREAIGFDGFSPEAATLADNYSYC